MFSVFENALSALYPPFSLAGKTLHGVHNFARNRVHFDFELFVFKAARTPLLRVTFFVDFVLVSLFSQWMFTFGSPVYSRRLLRVFSFAQRLESIGLSD